MYLHQYFNPKYNWNFRGNVTIETKFNVFSEFDDTAFFSLKITTLQFKILLMSDTLLHQKFKRTTYFFEMLSSIVV